MAAIAIAILAREGALLMVANQTEPTSEFQRWLVRELALAPADAASVEVVIFPAIVAGAAIFALVHAAALPWALAAERHRVVRARKLWLWASLAPAALVVLAGAAAWLRIALG